MKYFCNEKERIGTCYHEFQKGNFEKIECWKEDSLLIHDDIHYKIDLGGLIKSVIETYDPFGVVKVSRDEWEMIYENAQKQGGELKEAVLEANPWVERTFEEYEVFTMIGM